MMLPVSTKRCEAPMSGDASQLFPYVRESLSEPFLLPVIACAVHG